jgi:hypothetical protein
LETIKIINTKKFQTKSFIGGGFSVRAVMGWAGASARVFAAGWAVGVGRHSLCAMGRCGMALA